MLTRSRHRHTQAHTATTTVTASKHNGINDHRKARLAFKDDHRNVEFPLGTWWMARVCGVRVRPPP